MRRTRSRSAVAGRGAGTGPGSRAESGAGSGVESVVGAGTGAGAETGVGAGAGGPPDAGSRAGSTTAARRKRHRATTALTQTAATSARPVGRVRPASRQSTPAVTQRSVSTAYSDHATSAVNSDSV